MTKNSSIRLKLRIATLILVTFIALSPITGTINLNDMKQSAIDNHPTLAGTIQIAVKRADTSDENYGTSAEIAAGAKPTLLHKARVKITFDPPLDPEERAEITLENGGGGYAPAPAWWWPSSDQGKATIVFDEKDGIYTQGDRYPLSFYGETVLLGTLTSSNKVESTTVHVHVPTRHMDSNASVSFKPGTIKVTTGDNTFIAGAPHDYKVSLTFDGHPLQDHRLLLAVDYVKFADNTEIHGAEGITEGLSTDFSPFVLLEQDGRVVTLLTAPDQSSSTFITVVDPKVRVFKTRVGDLSVAE